MKNTLALVLMVFGSFGAFADSISIKGEMQCKVKDQIILKTEDGISKRYQGFAEDIKIGDTIILSYRYTNEPSVATASGLSIMNFNFNKEMDNKA